MDSIERMRRINDLTKELKQRGFAESSFEAINQANQIYGQDDLDDNVKHGIIQNSTHDRVTKNNGSEEANMDSTMNDKNVDKRLSSIVDTVEILTGKMNEMIRAINDIDARFNELKLRQDKLIGGRQEQRSDDRTEKQATEANQAADKTVEKEEQKPSSPEPHKDEYSMNQRTGNFQSQDVSIDKMFYFGKK